MPDAQTTPSHTELALFIATQVVEEGQLSLDTLAANLTAPHGWVGFGLAWHRGWIDVVGDWVFPTERGREFVALLNRLSRKKAP